MKYKPEDYLNEPWFREDESEISCQTIKFVRVRKEHPCWLSLGEKTPEHNVQKGGYAYYEKALVDGEFVSYYMCTDCMDVCLDEYYGYGEQDE